VGTLVTVSGADFPSNERLELVWHTKEGSWDIRGTHLEEYHGRNFEDLRFTIAKVKTNVQGTFSARIRVPEDYGFNHNITVERGARILNRTGFDIEPRASLQPTSGPLGTLIAITMTGIGWQSMENSWTLMYDNKYVGVLTAVTTKGTAKALIPATGGPGKHILRIIHGAYQYPYLNTEQNPRPDQPVITMEFIVTEGPPVLPPPPREQGVLPKNRVSPRNGSGPNLWIDPAVAPVETPVTLQGTGFPPGKRVALTWFSVVGNRISGSGWDETTTALGTTVVKDNGDLSLSFTAPDDLGGGHRIEATIGAEKITETTFVISPSALPLNVTSGAVGTPVTVHLKGVGWTETANIYHLVYDNAYLGYACGFNSQGDLTINLPLTGRPQWHFIDLYPGIYKGKEARGVRNFRVPQLTYERDHPGEQLPAFRFAVLVE
jgi:hypothetical protein